jgi:hypothetical protein
MQICWRRIGPGEIDHELLWLSVSVAALALASAWLALGLPWPHCMFLAITGHPCLTCGATRAAIQFLHGNFLAALRWNPLAFAFLCGMFVFNVYAGIVLLTRSPRLRISHLTVAQKNLVRILVIALLALNWFYLLITWRNL